MVLRIVSKERALLRKSTAPSCRAASSTSSAPQAVRIMTEARGSSA